ncbi:D-alanyl-D-alanine carboxypeptidase family protein [Roseibacillus ishigakijimensis]|uniref:D-alanyl-D-alanine carboxypeptidase n=1 Tax=Roseibacillus ishigakijimensis TaxID=454146 RepID=A0A934RTU0_9BACT|nr:serine hydrolase [Roseibacillus ishigakijimensis]MBK1834924.1 D-alanyl-D-alanine carboxypeptidase [Roseibacillus ishigakijimensis]
MKNLWQLLAVALIGCMVISCVGPSGGGGGGPDSGGEAYLVVEAHSGKVVTSRNATATRSVASLSQVATAVVAFDWSSATGNSLAQQAIVPPDVVSIPGPNPMGLLPGDQIALRDALYSMLMGSDTAAAQTVAAFIGHELQQRRGVYGSVSETFVAEMNQLAGALGMSRTRFVNAHGSDGGVSTAEDMARLAIYAMRHPGMAFYTKQKSRQIGFRRAGQSISFRVQNTNQLVGTQGINGLKAGQTPRSGPCLLISAERKPLVEKLPDGQARITPRRMIVVVLNSVDREGRALGLLNAGWAGYDQWLSYGGVASGQPQEILSVPEL